MNRPEPSVAEAVNGAITTVLNEKAVIGAVLGNKGGINIAVTYEAFAVKMLGAVWQEVIFARAKKERGYTQGWLSIPVVMTSHTWENGKNEQSHQDPTFCEALLGEMSDTARVFFPADDCSAVATLLQVYREHGQIACIVAPKREVVSVFSRASAEVLVARGAHHVEGNIDHCQIQLVAISAYQLERCHLASARLAKSGLQPLVTYMLEPGKFRMSRDATEIAFVAFDEQLNELFPVNVPRLIVSHTRPEPMIGVFANGATWAHIIVDACKSMGLDNAGFLSKEELLALSGQGDPRVRDAMILTCFCLIVPTVCGTSQGSGVVICGVGSLGTDYLRKRGTR
jgi:phosphoketolase